MTDSPSRPLSAARVDPVLNYWCGVLGVVADVRAVTINRLQVTDEHGRPGADLVGVVVDGNLASIYHTRPLAEDDIIHELLHVAHPEWSEEEVVLATTRLCDDRQQRLARPKSSRLSEPASIADFRTAIAS